MRLVTLAAVLAVTGCGGGNMAGGGGGGGGTDGGGSAIDAGGGSGSDGWQTLIERDWSLTAGQEKYECRRIQVMQDMWVTGFRAISPQGTHHQVLTITDNGAGQPQGDYDCSVGALDAKMLYAAGIGTADLDFPAGVATHIAAGSYINVNLHLFDTLENDITGTSGVAVQTIDASQVQNAAAMEFAGTFNIDIPSDGQPHTASGGCTVPEDWTVFTLWPHMHQTGTHQTFTVDGTALLDTDYSFLEQRNYPMAPTVLHAGQQVNVTCTYVNNSGSTKTFGESSNDEMCFTGMYKWPDDGDVTGCTTGGGSF
jgi:hypothetical protein|nr:hypothetical protein [Kofleriaceae bacterium]